MDAWIDGQPFAAVGETCAEMLAAARTRAARSGRVVVEVELDGQPLAGDEIESLAFRLAGSSRLRLTTEFPGVVVREALLDAAELLRQTDAPRDQAVAHIRAGRLGDALRSIESIAQTWEHVRRATEQSAELLGVPVGGLLAGDAAPQPPRVGTQTSNPTETLAVCLAEVKRCVEHADWSGLADVTEYDLAEQAATWFECLVAAAGRLADEAPVRAAG